MPYYPNQSGNFDQTVSRVWCCFRCFYVTNFYWEGCQLMRWKCFDILWLKMLSGKGGESEKVTLDLFTYSDPWCCQLTLNIILKDASWPIKIFHNLKQSVLFIQISSCCLVFVRICQVIWFIFNEEIKREWQTLSLFTIIHKNFEKFFQNKHLEILEANIIKQTEIFIKSQSNTWDKKEKLLQTKVCHRNLIKEINNLVSYYKLFLNWT